MLLAKFAKRSNGMALAKFVKEELCESQVSMKEVFIIRAIEVKMHNFRSIQDGSFELSPYSLLIGPNNAGKSNVIAAIRIFYEKGLKFDELRDFPKFETEDNETWVEIQFKPSVEEFAQLKEEYRLPDGTFRIRCLSR